MEETIAIRLKLFMDTNGLSSTQFADMCGIPRPSFSQLLSGRNKKVSDIVLSQIHRAFPDLSMNWLLFGEGPVKVSEAKKAAGNYRPEVEENGTLGENGSTMEVEMFSSGPDGPFTRIEKATNVPGGKASQLYSTDNGLTSSQNGSNYPKNIGLDTEIKILDLQRQIENLRQNPRKVLQITIYYDDSTFETFVPGSSKDK